MLDKQALLKTKLKLYLDNRVVSNEGGVIVLVFSAGDWKRLQDALTKGDADD